MRCLLCHERPLSRRLTSLDYSLLTRRQYALSSLESSSILALCSLSSTIWTQMMFSLPAILFSLVQLARVSPYLSSHRSQLHANLPSWSLESLRSLLRLIRGRKVSRIFPMVESNSRIYGSDTRLAGKQFSATSTWRLSLTSLWRLWVTQALERARLLRSFFDSMTRLKVKLWLMAKT